MGWVKTVNIETLRVGDRVLEVFWRGMHAFEEPATVLSTDVKDNVVIVRVRRESPRHVSRRDELTIERRVGEWAKQLMD